MKWLILILLGIFLFSFVSADGSSETQTDFNIQGCTFDFNSELIGVVAGECSRGDAEGHFYCDDDKFGWITTEEGRGCSLGEETYTLGDNFCCPSGMFCNKTGDKLFRCDRRIENCFNMTTKPDCEAIGCIWFNDICVENVRDFDCGIYDNKPDCDEDIWNLGQTGIGTEFCGTTIECNNGTIYTISEDECGCEWYPSAPEDKRCQVKLVGVQMFSDDIDTRDEFWCSNVYESGECIDGEQNITWYSTSSADQGFDTFGGIVPDDCLGILGCNGGETTRFCGEPIIKLSGFSLFSLFASLFIVGIYYFLSQNAEGLNKRMH